MIAQCTILLAIRETVHIFLLFISCVKKYQYHILKNQHMHCAHTHTFCHYQFPRNHFVCIRISIDRAYEKYFSIRPHGEMHRQLCISSQCFNKISRKKNTSLILANEEKSSILHENLDGMLFIANKDTLEYIVVWVQMLLNIR